MNNNDIKPQLKAIFQNHIGRTNAITRRELRVLLNDINDRKMRLLKTALIREGLPVLSATDNPAGYYMPASRQELQIGLKTLQSYIIELCKDYRDLKKYGGIWLERPQPVKQERLF